MSTESPDSLKIRIEALGLKIGNEVLESSTGIVTTPSRQNWIDSSGRLAAGTQQPFALGARVSTAGDVLFSISGKAIADVLTGTLVAGASVTTATKGAFARVNVTSDDDTVPGSAYYIQLFTIT